MRMCVNGSGASGVRIESACEGQGQQPPSFPSLSLPAGHLCPSVSLLLSTDPAEENKHLLTGVTTPEPVRETPRRHNVQSRATRRWPVEKGFGFHLHIIAVKID